MPRQLFERELQQLQDRLLVMASEVAQNIVKAVDVLKQRDFQTAQRLIRADQDINQEQVALELESLTLIATQQPTARDLRFIAAVIAVAGELERMNDYAKGIAKINLLIGEEELLPAVNLLPDMADKTRDMLERSLQAFVDHNLDQAYAIHAEDDEVDALYNQVYQDCVAAIMADANDMDQATHLLWAAHNLERTADRVSNICERVVFVVTGDIIEMPEEDEVSSLQ